MLFLQVNIFPLRFAIEMMCFIDSPPSKARFVTITSTLVGLSLLLALYVPHIGVVFGLMGSVGVGGHFVKLLLCPAIKGMIMTLGTFQAGSKENTDCIRHAIQPHPYIPVEIANSSVTASPQGTRCCKHVMDEEIIGFIFR